MKVLRYRMMKDVGGGGMTRFHLEQGVHAEMWGLIINRLNKGAWLRLLTLQATHPFKQLQPSERLFCALSFTTSCRFVGIVGFAIILWLSSAL